MVAPGSSSSDMAAAPPSFHGESLTPPLEPTLPGARSNLGIESPNNLQPFTVSPSACCVYMSLICNLSLFLPQHVTSIHSNFGLPS
jgi:hypothetical protein